MYFLLLNILPLDVVYYIYLINRSYKILKTHINKSVNNKFIIKNLITYIVSKNTLSLLLNSNFIALKVLYNEKIIMRRYELLYLLNSLCNKLNIINQYINNNFNKHTTDKYKRFKKYLIKICIKYNVKISLCVMFGYYDKMNNLICNNDYQSLVVPARKLFTKNNLIPVKYSNLHILDDNYIIIDSNNSNNYIKNFL